jgi:hypothetical protein
MDGNDGMRSGGQGRAPAAAAVEAARWRRAAARDARREARRRLDGLRTDPLFPLRDRRARRDVHRHDPCIELPREEIDLWQARFARGLGLARVALVLHASPVSSLPSTHPKRARLSILRCFAAIHRARARIDRGRRHHPDFGPCRRRASRPGASGRRMRLGRSFVHPPNVERSLRTRSGASIAAGARARLRRSGA